MSLTIETEFGPLQLAGDDVAGFPTDFFAWLKENKPVYAGFVEIAREGHRRGFSKWGAFAVVNVLRWKTAIREVDSRFKVNNNRAPWLARLAMKQFPELSGFFSCRATQTGVR